jgi:ComF family protein
MGGQYIEAMPPAPLARLPRPCAVCGRWARHGLCGDCEARFALAQPPRCPRCGLPGAAGAECGACLRQPPPFTRCITVADYGFPWDRLIARFKFQGQPELAGLLADALCQALQRAQPPPVAWVLPVPLGAARLAERGYNQAWELARRVAGALGLPAQAGWLQRLRDAPHQVGSGRAERERNLRDAIWVSPAGAAGVAGRPVALVDDVLTTGVTAAAATHALLAAGAASVQVWVLARTPAPER